MTTKTTRDKVAAALAAPDKATHATILELQQALQADIAGWHERVQATSKGDDGRMGLERRKLLEGGDVDSVLRMDVECEQLRMWIAGAQAQHAALQTLDKQVFQRESLANLPAKYADVLAELAAILEHNKALSEGWERVGELTGEAELMRNAVQRSGEDVPAPPEELAKALEAAWKGACPWPVAGAYYTGNRFNVAESLGLNAVPFDSGGLRYTAVKAA